MRLDLEVIKDWVMPNTHMLDLGCGDGSLLHGMAEQKNVTGYGLEISDELIASCIEKDVNVIKQDLNGDLSNFQSASFDVVVMTQALQAIKNPDKILDEMLRIGESSIITFPNFGHWRCRYHLAVKGKMPVSKILPYKWYDTPNIHLCTFKDFEQLCQRKSITILNRAVVDQNYKRSMSMAMFPNLFGETALYHVTRGKTS